MGAPYRDESGANIDTVFLMWRVTIPTRRSEHQTANVDFYTQI